MNLLEKKSPRKSNQHSNLDSETHLDSGHLATRLDYLYGLWLRTGLLRHCRLGGATTVIGSGLLQNSLVVLSNLIIVLLTNC